MRYIIIFFVILFWSCRPRQADTSTAPHQAPLDENTVPVKVATASRKSISLPLHASGVLTSSSEQRLAFKTGGIIRQILVKEGDVVRPGQLLAVLDKTEIEAQVAQARQALQKAERDLARVEGLYRDSSATLELLQNATTGRDVSKETVRIAEFNRQYSEIRATKGGTIIKKLANEGELIGPGMPVLVLFETGPGDWEVNILVSDRDWARLQKGTPARLTFDAYPGVEFSGTVQELPAAADPSNGLYPVAVKVSPQGHRFVPGLFAEVNISPRQAGVYSVIPVEAIVEGNGQTAYVYVAAPDNSVQKVPVTIAFLEGASAVLSAGPKEGQQVVVTGAPYLNERKKIAIIP